MLRLLALTFALTAGLAAYAAPMEREFPSIDGGTLHLSEWAGRPVLVVNTASRCGYTGQYEDLQALYNRYRDKGLIVLAVPSDDFRQELATAEEVKEFCELTFGIDMPMADISHVKGRKAHPFYKDVHAETGFEPRWNFNKVLIGRDGRVVATYGAGEKPMGRRILAAVEAELTR